MTVNVPVPPRGQVYVEHELLPVHHGFRFTVSVRALDPLDEAEALEVLLLHVAGLCQEHGVNPQEALREAGK